MSYYGVRINIGDDVHLGTPVKTDIREVRRLLLEAGEPGDGDNLIVFASDGRSLEVYDLDAAEFLPFR